MVRVVRTVRRCSRAGCINPAVATLTYAYADSTAVVGPLATYAEPPFSGKNASGSVSAHKASTVHSGGQMMLRKSGPVIAHRREQSARR